MPSSALRPQGRYLLRELLARGGMGEVFRALAVGVDGFEKPVVVKRILPALGRQPAALEMFAEEARLMSKLVHPNIVQVIDFGRGEHGEHFLVMELVNGVDLHRFRTAYAERGQPVPLSLALFVIDQVLRALDHVHTRAYGDGRTLVHRDVSPGNVLLSRLGEVKLGDFGVALVGTSGVQLGADAVVGKPSYMAPEQWRGEPLDGRADLFATAVVLFQLLTGELPFEGDDARSRQESAGAGRMRSLLELRAEAGEALDTLLRKALAADPASRFEGARAMRRALDGAGPLADGDELAEAVERILSESPPAARQVLSLGLGDSLGELTRLEGGTFTLHAPGTRPVGETPRRFPLGRAWLALLPLVAAGALLALPPSGRAPSLTEALPSGPAVDPAALAPSASPPAVTPSAIASAPSASATPVPTRATLEPPSPAPPPSTRCTGEVLLAAKGSWWVSGGPGRVQAPGRYPSWPCGSYTLTATSREDGRTVTRQLVVREGVVGSARFE